ncbi:MAG: hypothetical protein VW600_16185 [Ferrovibrio sp.]
MRLLQGLAVAGTMAVSLVAFTAPAEAGDKHHRHSPHYHGGGKPVFYGEPHWVDRRWYGPPAYYAYPPGYYVAPAPVYYYPPPPPRYVPYGPSISVTIPLG